MIEPNLRLTDCLYFMRKQKDNAFDVAITDPPYGVGRDVGFSGAGGFGGKDGVPIPRRQYKGGWDSERPPKEYFDELLRVSKTVLIFGGNFFADLLPVGSHWVVWDKKQTMPTFGDCELVWTNVNRNSVKWIQREWNGVLGKAEPREHPTQKPLKIMRWLVANYSKVGDTIFDPFMGVGSTGVASIELDRRFVGCEIDPEFFLIAHRRITQATRQPVLFDIEDKYKEDDAVQLKIKGV